MFAVCETALVVEIKKARTEMQATRRILPLADNELKIHFLHFTEVALGKQYGLRRLKVPDCFAQIRQGIITSQALLKPFCKGLRPSATGSHPHRNQPRFRARSLQPQRSSNECLQCSACKIIVSPLPGGLIYAPTKRYGSDHGEVLIPEERKGTRAPPPEEISIS